MNREYQGDQILQQGTKQSQNLVQNDITGDINSNQQVSNLEWTFEIKLPPTV